LVVAPVAGYASYVHQREFALQGGADAVSATLWPLSVEGLLLRATVAGRVQVHPIVDTGGVPVRTRSTVDDVAGSRPHRVDHAAVRAVRTGRDAGLDGGDLYETLD
jgi:hypothetical protein